MKITKAWIDWYLGWANNPRLNISIDSEYPTDFLYEKRNGIYYAESEFIASYFHYISPGDGYGGQKFHLNIKDGTKETLIGPWSSNSGSVNNQGFGPCIEATIWTPKFKNCGVAGNITLTKAVEIVAELNKKYQKWFCNLGVNIELKFDSKFEWYVIQGKKEIEERVKHSALIQYNEKFNNEYCHSGLKINYEN